MHILVNGVRLFVDVANAGLVPDGDRMREKPALLMLHGGPGFDHVPFKDAFSVLSDVAQVIFYDHRGNGRSEGGDPSAWNLAQWGDDVKGLCDPLGVVKPIVCGRSFGGFVAQSYATRYPEHPGKLILLSTAAKIDFPAVFETFTQIGGPEIGALAESYLTNPTAEGRAVYRQHCVPFYRHRRDRPADPMRAIIKAEVGLHFNGPRNEHGRFDFHDDLAKVACPVLMIGGEHDPIVPISLAEATARALPSHLVRFERLANCGHDIHGDDPDTVFSLIREFIADGPITAAASVKGFGCRPVVTYPAVLGAGVRKPPRKEPAGSWYAVCRLWGFDGAACWVGDALAGVVGGGWTITVASLSPRQRSPR